MQLAGQPPPGFPRLLRTLSKKDVLHETTHSDLLSTNVRTVRGLYFLLMEWFARAILATLLEVAKKSRGILLTNSSRFLVSHGRTSGCHTEAADTSRDGKRGKLSDQKWIMRPPCWVGPPWAHRPRPLFRPGYEREELETLFRITSTEAYEYSHTRGPAAGGRSPLNNFN